MWPTGLVPCSGVIAPHGTIDDTGGVELSMETKMRAGATFATRPTKTSKVPDRKKREMPRKKMCRVFDIQKNNQVKDHFTGVPETNMLACFNRLTWSPSIHMQQPALGTSHLILGDSLVEVLQNSRTSWITNVMAIGGATIG